MPLNFEIKALSYPTRGAFKISRSSVTTVQVLHVSLQSDAAMGRGECRPYPRYNQSVESVLAELETVRPLVEADNVSAALDALAHGAARNALESCWIDFQAKKTNKTAASLLGVARPSPRKTAFTLSWGSVAEMKSAAKAAFAYPFLKIKIGEDGINQVLAVATARPDAQLIIDANEALAPKTLPAFLDALSGLNVALIEQPLPAGHCEVLPETGLIICADEGLHSSADLPQLWAQGYRAVNVKLDKCGGPIAARDLILEARNMGFKVMAGCMVGSSLAMAPMMTLESLCDIIDLDGPLLLANDIDGGLKYEDATVFPPNAALWG